MTNVSVRLGVTLGLLLYLLASHLYHFGIPIELQAFYSSGDFTNRGTREEIQEFDAWLGELHFQHKVAKAV